MSEKRSRFSVSVVSNEDFVTAYVADGATRQTLAEEFDVPVSSVQNRIVALKKAGVELPKLVRPSRAAVVDVAGLNALINNESEE